MIGITVAIAECRPEIRGKSTENSDYFLTSNHEHPPSEGKSTLIPPPTEISLQQN